MVSRVVAGARLGRVHFRDVHGHILGGAHWIDPALDLLSPRSDNAGAFTALTNTVPFGGANAGLQLSSTPILGNNKTGTHNDVMNFNINLAPLPNLPANTFTATLTIQAQAI